MNPMGGIDQQIQQRKMQFKDNPQQLQQRYGQNKELLDLLALQEISKEQQQRSQRMQMEAQQNPATVADQMQQEVLQGKKAEMAQGLQGIKGLRERTKDVGGALAQKQQQQQQRMQQQGQQPQRPPQQQQRPQGQPMMAAAGGLMTQAAPNIDPRYFEGGGIVAFDGTAGSGVMGAGNRYVKDPIEQAIANFSPFQDSRRSAYKKMLEKMRKGEQLSSGELKALRDYKEEFPELKAEEPAPVDVPVKDTAGDISDEENADIDAAIAATAVDDTAVDDTAVDDAAADDAAADDAAGAGAGLDNILSQITALQSGAGAGAGAGAAPRSTGSISPEFSMTPEENANQQQQAQGNRLRQGLAINAEEALGAGGGAQGIEALNQGQLFNSARLPPEGIRRPEPAAPAAPEKQLTPQQQYLKLVQAQEEAINKKEEGLKDTRSNTRRLLDRLTDAAINASKRPAATTNRGALASLGLGVSEAVRAEEAERKEGLADIAKRRGELIDRQLAGQLGLAQISQGDKGLDIQERAATTAEATLAESTRQFNERLASTEGQFDQQLAVSKQQWEGSNALAVLEAQRKTIGEQATINLKEAELNALTAFQNAKTNIGNQDLQIKAQQAMGDYEADVLKLQQEALTALGLDSRYTGNANKALRDKQVEIIKLEFADLIANKRKDLASILGGGSGTVSFGNLK
jgi:hypothetical protein